MEFSRQSTSSESDELRSKSAESFFEVGERLCTVAEHTLAAHHLQAQRGLAGGLGAEVRD
jgi:hypothetical protein